MMPRPIFVIRFRRGVNPAEVEQVHENMKESNPDIFKEYHILFANGSNGPVEFEMYHPNSIPEKEYKRMKGLIHEILDNLK